jgi:7-carboxy-7-deazaguanine synthase (Cx14CxxC type)
MGYAVKELFYTLQGEGSHTGRSAVFCRFAGCNLWSGRESDRASATCRFCDTDFIGTDGPGGGKFADADALADAVLACWDAHALSHPERRFVVLTGGEPLLQVDAALCRSLHARGFYIAIETNGTQPVPTGPAADCIDWVCVSPKAGSTLVLDAGDELKLVFPQPGAEPERFVDLRFSSCFLQPMDGPLRAENTASAIAYCQRHPRWRLSLQTHKLLGIP